MGKSFQAILIGILVLAVLLRVGAALYLGNEVENLPGTADQISYHTLALRLLGGHGFSFGEGWWPATAAEAPTAHWSFLYTGYLALVYALFGPNPLAARLIQAVLVGILQPYLAYRLGRRVFSPAVGLAAAGLTGLYAYFIYYAANLMTEAFYITAILASLLLTLELGSGQAGGQKGPLRAKRGGEGACWDLKRALALGLVLGCAVLLRQLFLLFVPFLFLWILWASRGRQLPACLAAGVLIVAMILPFSLYNYSRFGRFVLLNTNAGYAFFFGNHPSYGTQFEPILPTQEYYRMIPKDLLSLDEAALDQALLKLGIEEILRDPARYLLLSLSRTPAYFMFWSSGESGQVSNLARVASFGLLWPFMLYGLIRSFSRLKSGSPPAREPLLLLYLFMLVYTGIHLLTWALIRYRLPVDAVLVLFAGLAGADLGARIPALRRLVRRTA